MNSGDPNGSRKLSRDQILEVALGIADSDGLRTLTMRRLAADLDVGVMSLYRHVATKGDLLDGVVHLALESLDEPDRHGAWDHKLTSAIGSPYSALREHPGATQALADGFVPGPALDPVRDKLLGILLKAGCDAGHAVDYLHTLFTRAVGFAIVGGRDSVSAADSVRINASTHERFPSLAHVGREYEARLSSRSFDAGVALIVDGIRAALERRGAVH